MTRRTWLLLLTAALGSGPLPACGLLGGRGAAPTPKVQVVPVTVEAASQRVNLDTQTAEPNVRIRTSSGPSNESPQTLAGSESVQLAPVPNQLPAIVTLPPVAPAAPVPPPEPMEPLVAALRCLLKNQPDEALTALQKYDARTQEVFLSLLPQLIGLTNKGLDRMLPSEVAAFQDQLQRLQRDLRCHAELLIDKACFCESIEGYGDYKPLPAQHRFQPPRDSQPGELVQLYVELRNFHCVPRDGVFQTRLSSSVEVRDEKGATVWIHNFQDREKPLPSLAPRNDYFNNYSFYLPAEVRPGRYQLTIQVIDQTREPNRTARKTVDFVVATGP